MTDFTTTYNSYNWELVKRSIHSKTAMDVEMALKKTKRNLEDFKALISPAAASYLEQMAVLSRKATLTRFGNTIQMYIPLYLSNECQNICTYCGFSYDVKVERKTLTDEEILQEVAVIKKMEYDHILLVTGESNKNVGVKYLENAIKLVKPYFSNISIEVQPMEEEEYRKLIAVGLNTVLVYQETYHKQNYKEYHKKGKKSNFYYRLKTPDRLGRAGIYKMGLGALLGLEDWRVDSFFTGLHLTYLENRYWQTKFSISFPRIRPCAGGIAVQSPLTDKELTQLMCAYRLYNDTVELSLSTRESSKFRDNIIKFCITSISADSKTSPGGYTETDPVLQQFEIADHRTTKDIVAVLKSKGYEPVWKDWDEVLQP